MGKCFQLLFVLVLSGSAPGAAAESLGYTFVSADYYKFSSKIDGISEVPEGSGMSYAFSIAVRPYIAVTGAYTTGSGHVNTLEASIDTDIESTSMGVLIHLPINETADFILATGFINGGAEVKKNGTLFATVDEDGGVTTMGFRAMATDNLEFNAFIHKKSIEGASRVGLSLGLSYYFTKSVSFDLDYFIDSDIDSLAFGLKKYF